MKKMRVTASRKKMALASVVVALSVVTVALFAYPALARPQQPQNSDTMLNDEDWGNLEQFLQMENATVQLNNVTAKAKGWAFQRIENETIKQYPMEMNLTLVLGQKKRQAIAVANSSGSLRVNGVIYTLESGKGLIATNRHLALVRVEGIDGQGNKITLKIAARYFWLGGHLYAFRGKAILQTTEKPVLLLFRGMAKVQ